MNRPRVTTKCVADHYAAPNERIIEFSSGQSNGVGGLIALSALEDGRLLVSVYRCSEGVIVRAEEGVVKPS